MRKMPHDVFDGLPYVLPASEKKPRRLDDLYEMARADAVAKNQRDNKPAAPAPAEAAQDAPPAENRGGQHQARPQPEPAPSQTRGQRQQNQPEQPQERRQYGRPAPVQNDEADPADPADDWREGMEEDDIPF